MSSLVALGQPLVLWLAASSQQVPEPEDVKAGWLGFAVFLALAAAVAVLGFSLRKQLRRVDFEERDDARPAAPAEQEPEPVDAPSGRPGPVTENDPAEGSRPPLS